MITCTRIAGKHWIVLYISSHLSSMPCLSFTKNRVHGSRDNAMCVRRPGLRDIASILTVTHVTDARETRDHPSFSLLRMTWILVLYHALCLEGLTQVEQMLIARGCPVMCVYKKKGGQCGYKNHVLYFPHDIQGFLDSLPSYVSDLPFLVVRRMGQDNSHRVFKVRRTRLAV